MKNTKKFRNSLANVFAGSVVVTVAFFAVALLLAIINLAINQGTASEMYYTGMERVALVFAIIGAISFCVSLICVEIRNKLNRHH